VKPTARPALCRFASTLSAAVVVVALPSIGSPEPEPWQPRPAAASNGRNRPNLAALVVMGPPGRWLGGLLVVAAKPKQGACSGRRGESGPMKRRRNLHAIVEEIARTVNDFLTLQPVRPPPRCNRKHAPA